MRSGFLVMLMVAILTGGGYWFYIAEALCNIPISYRIGTIDPRFKVSNEEVRNAVSVAESMWEDATGKNLFTYSEDGDVPVNFVFDERQQKANDEEILRETLDAKEGMSESVRAQYDALLSKYDALKAQYEKRTVAYEHKLSAYNREVNEWNAKNGAPPEIYERLSHTQKELDDEEKKLNSVAQELNGLVQKMNTVGSEGNSLITDYNTVVEEYNSKFSEGREFTQGDYEAHTINIYQYDSEDELEIVLAHELGHALSLQHVEDPASVMYHLMEKQTKGTGITPADVAQYTALCGTEAPFLIRIRDHVRDKWVHN